MILIAARQAPLIGEVSLPGDKSIAHRAALLAAMARGRSQISNFLVAGVTLAMLRVLAGLGVPSALQGATLEIEGPKRVGDVEVGVVVPEWQNLLGKA